MDFDALHTKNKDKYSSNDKELTQLSGDCSQDLQKKDLSEQTPILIKQQLGNLKLVGEDEHERLIEANMKDDAFNKTDDNKNNELGANKIDNQNNRSGLDNQIRINKLKILPIVTIGLTLLLIY